MSTVFAFIRCYFLDTAALSISTIVASGYGECMYERIRFFKQVDILSILDEKEIGGIIALSGRKDLNAGDVLFMEGDEGSEMYIVESGEISVLIRLPEGGEKEIAQIAPGSFFGEMSLFENAPRSATCCAKTDTGLLVISRSSFFHLIDESPVIAVKIMSRMLSITAGRLKKTGRFVSDTVRWGEEALKKAVTDDLTGIYNRRFLDEALKEQFAKAAEKERPLSIVMVDMDHFRSINDQHGDALGDRLMLGVVDVFKSHVRGAGITARYGGDEFMILLPNTGQLAAHKIAEAIRDDVKKIDLLRNLDGKIKMLTVSQGIASFPDSGATVEELKSKADRALYSAKESGRDRVVCA